MFLSFMKSLVTFYASALLADPERKPNIIFDVTLKDLRKLEKITNQVSNIGYDRKNIHIVWVINDIEVAIDQNAKRSRVVPLEILVNTHRGVSNTMMDVINMGKTLKKYMDGDIVFAFNKVGIDSNLRKSNSGGKYLEDSNFFYIKKAGGPILSLDKISKDVRSKISSYVPKNVEWS
jgi:hypothetical protein